MAVDAKVKRGERYWVAVLGTGGALKVRNHAGDGGDKRETSRKSALSALPEAWKTGTLFKRDGPLAAFAA